MIPIADPQTGVSQVASIIHSLAALGLFITAIIGLARFRNDHRKTGEQKAAELKKREEATRVSKRELQWKRAVQAQEVLDRMESDRLAADAMLMLDWNGRRFPSDNPSFMIYRADMLEALRTDDRTFSESEVYVRDCFDRLFWYFERLNHQMAVGMISPAHVSFPLKYIVSLILQEDTVFRNYLTTFHCNGVLSLIDIFKQQGAEPLKPPYQSLETVKSGSIDSEAARATKEGALRH